MKKLKGKAMRKTLLASAALIVMGGGAYAEVSVTGSGNFGVKFDGAKSGSEALTFHHEFDITFEASGTTDGGLTFGGKVSIDDRESGSGTADLVKLTKGTGSCYIDTTISGVSKIYVLKTDGTAPGNKKGELDPGDTLEEVGDFGLNWHATKALLDVAKIMHKKVEALPKFAISTEVNTKGLVTKGTSSSLREYENCSKIELTRTTSGTIDNNASVHIGFDVHTLTIGDGLDAGDVAAGGVADLGFDGIGVDDVAESLRGKTSVDVVYTGSFGVANVRVSSGGDDNWGVGFNFNVAPVTIGVGFDSNKVASIGLGLTQGPVSGKLLYSTESENDMKAYGAEIGYTISEGTSVTIVYSQSKDPAGSDGDAVGFGFSHGLGGGATLAAGIGQVNDQTKADLGITMAF